MFSSGQIINDTYEIREKIGSGGGGIIYKGYHLRMQIPVAIKLIKNEAKGIIDQRSEVDLLKQLKNDYIPQVLDFIIDGNDVYTVMEFVEGNNFKQLITLGRSFSEKDVLRYISQLCTAVKYLHSHNPPIIHSDIKPANIMLKPDDSICLIDFNISTMASKNGAFCIGGSKGFAAPEQFKKVIEMPVNVDEFHEETRFLGDDDETEFIDSENGSSKSTLKTKNISKAYVDTRTDIYGIGSSMYYMLTGRVPSTGNTDFRGVKVSPKTQKIIRKCMNPDPAKRYANVSDLENAISSKGSSAIIAAAAAVLIIGIGAVAVINSNSSAGIESDSYNTDSVISVSASETESSAAAEVMTVETETTIAAEINVTEASTTPNITTAETTTTRKSNSEKPTEYIYAEGDFPSVKIINQYTVNPEDFNYDTIELELFYIDKVNDCLVSLGRVNSALTGTTLIKSLKKYSDGSIPLDFDNKWLFFDGDLLPIYDVGKDKVTVSYRTYAHTQIHDIQAYYRVNPKYKKAKYISIDKIIKTKEETNKKTGTRVLYNVYNSKGAYESTEEYYNAERNDSGNNMEKLHAMWPYKGGNIEIKRLSGEYAFRYVFSKNGTEKYSDIIYRNLP